MKETSPFWPYTGTPGLKVTPYPVIGKLTLTFKL